MNPNRTYTSLLAAMIASALMQAHAADNNATAVPDVATAPQQTTSDETPQKTTPKKATAATNANPQQPVTLPDVTVTPLQQSLENAQSIKQNARMVVDSIVAEDIGKLPDNSVADALQRITGVQVSQGFQGETTGVVVRGLPNVVTTLDGREIFNSGGREFSFQDLPATAVSGIDVYKSTDATMITGGIAGTVDIRTFHPLDFDGPRLAATWTDTHQKFGGHTDPTGSLLLSDRWSTGAGEFGALLNMGITTMHYGYNAAFIDDNLTSVLTDGHGNPVRTPQGNLLVGNNSFGADYNSGWRLRPEMNYALQWKPNDSTEVYVEGLYTWISDRYDQPFYGALPASVVNPTSFTASNACFPIGLTGSPYFGQTVCPLASATFSGNFYAFTSTQAHEDWGHNGQNSIGVKWHGDNLRLSTDFTRNGSSYENDNFVIDTFLNAYNNPLTFNYQAPNNSFNFSGNPQLNPANYYLNGLYQQWNNNKATQDAWRGTGNYSFGDTFISSIDFGLRYADTQVNATGASLDVFPPGGANLANGAPNPANNVVSVFGSSYLCPIPLVPSIPNGALTGCYNYLIDNENALRAYYGLPAGKLPPQQGQFFDIGEKTYSAFAQVNYGREIFGLPFDGVIGVRFEQIHRELDAYTYDSTTNVYSPIGLQTKDNNVLPNATFNLHFTDTLQMRLSAGKTIQYPDFTQLNPSLSLSPATANVIATGSGGNAYLKPTKSNSYDATLEWYFSDVGSLTGGLFYHDITGYIENYTFLQNIGGATYLISGPQSSGEGHLDGVELAYTQFFSWLPGALSGFGIQANYTYIGNALKTPAITGTGFINATFQNVSKNNYNIVLMYEKYGFSARLAYNYRSPYPEFFLAASSLLGNNAQMYDRPANMLDFSLGYEVNSHLTVVLNATNLNKANFRSYAGNETALPNDLRYQDRSIGLGARLKF